MNIIRLSIVLVIGLLPVGGYHQHLVHIPEIRSSDSAPHISIIVTPVSPARVSYSEATTDTCHGDLGHGGICSCYITKGEAVITALATNDGGVKSLSLDLKADYSGTSAFVSAKVEVQPDRHNMAPQILRIVGHNNAGGVGSNHITYRSEPAAPGTAVWPRGRERWVEVKAENFNGQQSRLHLKLTPQDPISASIHAIPNPVIIGRDQTVLLNFSYYGATSVSLSATTVNPPIDPKVVNPRVIWSLPGPPLDYEGGIEAANLRLPLLMLDREGTLLKIQQDTVFTLTASNFIYDECSLPDKGSCPGAEIKSSAIRVNVNR